jgi:mannitol-specific phosphotransferase system IIBC component
MSLCDGLCGLCVAINSVVISSGVTHQKKTSNKLPHIHQQKKKNKQTKTKKKKKTSKHNEK